MTQKDSNNYPKLKGNIITDEIKSLRRKVLEIMAPYRRPISSILPEKREVDEKEIYDIYYIDAIAEKLREAPGNISTNTLREWLNQFDTLIEKNIAYLLLKEIQFFSEDNIKSSVRNLRDKLLDFLIDQEHLREVFHSLENPAAKTEIQFKRWLRNKVIRYAWLPQPQTTGVESQHGLWDYYEIHALTGSETACPSASKPRLLKDYFENPWYNDPENVTPENTVFVFMDYINGTGRQLSKCVPLINDLLEQSPQWKKSFFIFMYIAQSKVFKKENVSLSSENWQTIYNEPVFSYKDSKIMQILSSHKILEIEYENFVNKYCQRAGSTSLGYLDSGSLTCFYRSCPNNTLTFFWKSSADWTAIFDHSQTPNATRYGKR
ncbi:MAG: hypothetical protein RM022_022350 [Nostoc sp. EfeVER01]|uniref:phosphoribosyltransferase-like protein n=1 Tax=unclassified Nostoc TaxID=2593658 RepID=UPI002AD1F862|nr:hypothetical protein [Nostoc sp. EspVER01]MDZ7995669.1 hypothetical protein [Nostoc sp. EspVER01]